MMVATANMKIDQFVTNEEYSKLLFTFGVPQVSQFYWQNGEVSYRPEYCNWGVNEYGLNVVYGSSTISAFTFAELYELLPKGEFSIERKKMMWPGSGDTNYCIWIIVTKPTKHKIRYDAFGATMQDAAAYLVATLIRSGDIVLENVPKQIT